MKNVIFFSLLTLALFSCKKESTTESFTAKDYVGTFGRTENCSGTWNIPLSTGSEDLTPEDDIVISYGQNEDEIILQEYLGWNFPGTGYDDVIATVDGGKISFSKNHIDAFTYGKRWEFSGTGVFSNDKTKLTLDYRVYVESDESGIWVNNNWVEKDTTIISEKNCTSILTRK